MGSRLTLRVRVVGLVIGILGFVGLSANALALLILKGFRTRSPLALPAELAVAQNVSLILTSALFAGMVITSVGLLRCAPWARRAALSCAVALPVTVILTRYIKYRTTLEMETALKGDFVHVQDWFHGDFLHEIAAVVVLSVVLWLVVRPLRRGEKE